MDSKPSVEILYQDIYGNILWACKNFLDMSRYRQALNDLPLAQNPPVTIFGKQMVMRRGVGFFSDESEGYRFAGQISKSTPLTPELSELLYIVNTALRDAKAISSDFNGILVNRYQDGLESIGAHSDDESGLNNGVVASLSVGATRKFRLRDKKTKKILRDYDHQEGELLVMADGKDFTKYSFQKCYTHEITKTTKCQEPRISLTFRRHVS